MSNPFATRSGMLTRLFTVTALAGLLIGVGCSDDDEGGNGGEPAPTTSLYGAFVGSGDGGSMSITVSTGTLAPGLPTAKLELGAGGSRIVRPGLVATADVGASGSINLSGGPVIALTGTYGENDTLNLTGGGYTFVGAYDSTGSLHAITGGYSGPNGIGFFGILVGNSSTITVLCGTFENMGATMTGRLNLIIAGDDVGGAGFPEGSSEGAGFEGTVTGTGNPRTITLSGETGTDSFTAVGTWDILTNTVSGTWETSDGISVTDSGTWQASLCE